MRRLRSVIFTSVLLFFLLVGLCAVAFWIRSYWRMDLVGRESATSPEGRRRGGNISSALGVLQIVYWNRFIPGSTGPPEPWGGYSAAITQPKDSADNAYFLSVGGHSFCGFGYARFDMNPFEGLMLNPGSGAIVGATQNTVIAIIPYWSIASIGGIAGVFLIRRWRWHRLTARVRAGHCAICGYDLRASADRCPECGNVA